MNVKGISLSSTTSKVIKRCLAWLLTLAMIFSGVPFRGSGGVLLVSADNTELNDDKLVNKAASGSAVYVLRNSEDGEYVFDVTASGNKCDTESGWTSSNGYYTLSSTSPGTKITQGDSIFGYYTTGGKVKVKEDNSGFQLDGSVNKSGQAAIEIDLTDVPSGIYELELAYRAKGSSAATIQYGTSSGLSATDSSNASTTDFVTYTTTFESGSVYLIGATNGMFIKSLKLSKMEDIEIHGTVTASTGTVLPDAATVIFKEVTSVDENGKPATYGEEYNSSVIAADGTYQVEIPASSIEKEYEVTFSDGSYILNPELGLLTITKYMTDEVNLTVEKVNSYTLTGSYKEGLEDYSKVSALVFEAVTDSSYTVPETTLDKENGTYSIKLEKGTTYKVTATGVNDYQVASPETIKFDEDAEQDITFSKKPQYKVTISTGSTPDLSLMNIEYIFIHEDGSKYSFTDVSNIELRDGSYTVSVGGDFEKVAYGLASGKTLTVNGAAVSHIVTFTPVTSWSFVAGTGEYYNKTIQSGSGYYQGLYIDATSGKLAPNGATPNSAQFNTGAVINVPVTGKCTIAVNAYQAKYAEYTIDGKAADTNSVTTTVSYEGGAGYVKIESIGSAYIASISVTYPAKDVEFVQQTEMPFVAEDDTDANTAVDTDKIPRASKSDSITVQPVGQKLNITQTGGAFSGTYDKISNIGYYLFPMTKENNKLEFDLVIHSAGSDNGDGAFIGLFTNRFVYTLGIRKGTNARAIYSKAAEGQGDFAGAGGINNTIELGVPMHIEVGLSSGKPAVTYTIIETGESGAVSLSTLTDTDDGFYYGLVVSDASVTITNMLYTAEDGSVLYDQNSCYYPEGSAPIATTVTAEAAESREYIDIKWEGSVAEDDGTYVVEMSKDDSEWVELTDSVVGFTYRYILPEGDGGNYRFRVCGQLGKKELGGTRNSYVEMTTPVYVLGALAKPVVEATGNASTISLSWENNETAEYFLVYRYSYDEGEDAISQVAKVAESSFIDTTVEQEMPYYYKVKAVSEATNNESPLSETVWAVATAGHTGEYVYEDEATEIILTKKSYDTVFSDKVLLEGVVQGDGKLSAYVNGSLATSKALAARETFSFELTVVEGRNDVNLIFEDAAGNQTRKTYNFVYLTNYDSIVDSSYSGTDGALVDGIPTYKTVQAAVDSISSGNTENKVILVLAGDYKERLVVNTPYVSLIGEDRESTIIHFYPGELGAKYEAGGDMDKRCATYIQSGATGFSAENISFVNDYVYSTPDNKSNKSADALRCDADEASFVNVKFTGVQDTLYMHQGHQYYYKCRIEGLIDFIYSGDEARAFFNDCEIIFVYESTKTSGYVCAPKTAKNAEYGLTFYNCVIIGEEGCSGTGYLLARPWGADAYITWINCYMGKSVYKILPYGAMSGNQYQDARFFEFGTYGPGFAINVDRRQISPEAASNMVSNSFLGWAPDSVIAELSEGHYVGTIETNRGPMYVTDTVETDTYLWTDGDDTGLRPYNMEGYASAYKVSGGGLLMETSENYYKVDSAEGFLNALIQTKTSGKKSVIELTADINLGCKEIENFDSYGSIITAYSAQPLTHPTLLETGVSVLNFANVYNLTIFSSNASSIKHANITMKNSENIIIRNIKFDELWEWDEATAGDYDRNDWDYMTIDQSCNGIWIDHCTFYKAYDGVIDVKNPAPTANVTISWCEFLPGSEEDIFFDVMMNELAAHPDQYPTYQHMLDEGMTTEQIYMYAYGQKKTHLFGQSDESVNAAGIQVTLANNYYKNSMDRMPRLRYGYTHVYNCIMDAQDLLDAKNTISNSDIAKKIVSNGASSTCGAKVLLENCYINGIQNALNSGNGSSAPGYINAVNSVYYMDGEKTALEPKNNSTNEDQRVLIMDEETFRNALPYSGYLLYDAEKLNTLIQPHVGAGKLELTVLQWEKTGYNDDTELGEEEPDEPETPSEPETPEETTPEETAPEETTPEETTPEETTPEETTPEETIPNRPTQDDSDDDDDDYEEQETTSLTRREENLVASVAGVSSVKEVTENNNGKLVVAVNNEVVFLEKDGTLSKDKWQQVEGSWYFFGTDSKAVGGWLERDGKWYHMNETDKKMETGWLQTENGKWYLLDSKNGDMKTGWQQTADGKWYLLDGKNGDMKTGWQQTADGKWYLLDGKNGDMKTGWQQTVDGKWYLLDGKNGDMKTGWQQTADGKWYLLDSKNGDMKVGWQIVKGIWYYLTTTGAMAEDTITPDGYKVGKDGAWTGEKVR